VLKPKLIIFLIEVELARAKLKAKTDLFLNRIEFACGAASQESFCWVKNNWIEETKFRSIAVEMERCGSQYPPVQLYSSG
jgi:hypothetical protein